MNEKQQAAAEAKGLIGSSLYQIPLPEKLETRTYGALFSHLVKKKKQIPLGLLRGVFNNTKSGPKGNSLPYVFTNPPKDTELFSCDRIFVLSQTPVKITRATVVRAVFFFLRNNDLKKCNDRMRIKRRITILPSALDERRQKMY